MKCSTDIVEKHERGRAVDYDGLEVLSEPVGLCGLCGAKEGEMAHSDELLFDENRRVHRFVCNKCGAMTFSKTEMPPRAGGSA